MRRLEHAPKSQNTALMVERFLQEKRHSDPNYGKVAPMSEPMDIERVMRIVNATPCAHVWQPPPSEGQVFKNKRWGN
jgi:hypothetical protein